MMACKEQLSVLGCNALLLCAIEEKEQIAAVMAYSTIIQ